MDVWDWIHRFLWDAMASGDTERAGLADSFREACNHMESDPDRALDLLTRGRRLAEQLHEPWWVLFYDHWRLQVSIHYKRDYTSSLELAVRSTVEARKPNYEQLPQRICLHEDLINTYVGIDAVGHAGAIRAALEYMEGQVSPGMGCYLCLQGLRLDFAIEMGWQEEAEKQAHRYLSLSQDSVYRDYRLPGAYIYLCRLAYRRGSWEALLEYSQEGEKCARRAPHRRLALAELLAWQALAWRKSGNAEQARRFYRSATSQMSRLNSSPDHGYYEALYAYHEAGGNLKPALQTLHRELNEISGKGRLADECRQRIQICRLLSRMGLPLEEELAAAREAAGKLQDPAPFLEELDEITRTSNQK